MPHAAGVVRLIIPIPGRVPLLKAENEFSGHAAMT